jgi:hypothetical protein
MGGGTPLPPSCSNSDSPPYEPDRLRSSDEAADPIDMDEVLYFLLGGAGGFRRIPLTGVEDLEPAFVVLEAVDWNEAAEPGLLGASSVRDSDTSLRDDCRTGSREV